MFECILIFQKIQLKPKGQVTFFLCFLCGVLIMCLVMLGGKLLNLSSALELCFIIFLFF